MKTGSGSTCFPQYTVQVNSGGVMCKSDRSGPGRAANDVSRVLPGGPAVRAGGRRLRRRVPVGGVMLRVSGGGGGAEGAEDGVHVVASLQE